MQALSVSPARDGFDYNLAGSGTAQEKGKELSLFVLSGAFCTGLAANHLYASCRWQMMARFVPWLDPIPVSALPHSQPLAPGSFPRGRIRAYWEYS